MRELQTQTRRIRNLNCDVASVAIPFTAILCVGYFSAIRVGIEWVILRFLGDSGQKFGTHALQFRYDYMGLTRIRLLFFSYSSRSVFHYDIFGAKAIAALAAYFHIGLANVRRSRVGHGGIYRLGVFEQTARCRQ